MIHSNNLSLKPANTENCYHISKADLPLCCPMPDMALWNAHPKVYLHLDVNGKAKCPYCSADFVLS